MSYPLKICLMCLPWKYLRPIVLLSFFSIICVPSSFATHLTGDEFTYKYMGDTTPISGTLQKYRVTLSIYEDCLAGNPEAIAQDNPAYLGVFDGSGTLVQIDTAVFFSSAVILPGTSSGPCGIGSVPGLCIIKKTFVKDYYLHPGSSGYTIAYQRRCKNLALTNIVTPGNEGSTYFCKIPPAGVAASNNSAVFTYDPPEAVANNSPFVFYSSATDADGDSLSYELCTAYSGANDSTNSKPFPDHPPYEPVNYVPSLSFGNPMSCSVPVSIDPVTGVLTGTPNVAGRYLITLCCHEWRGGVMINTVNREFELAVGDFSPGTYQPFAGNDTAIMVGDSIQFNASDAATYLWSSGTYLTDTNIYDPLGHFPDPGYFTYILHGVSDSGCTGNDTINITVLEHSEYRVANAFSPNNDGLNDFLTPKPLKNSTLISFKIYNRDGKLLYTGTDQGAGWDGTYNGVKQPMDAYLWQLFYRDNYGRTREMKGNATLLR